MDVLSLPETSCKFEYNDVTNRGHLETPSLAMVGVVQRALTHTMPKKRFSAPWFIAP